MRERGSHAAGDIIDAFADSPSAVVSSSSAWAEPGASSRSSSAASDSSLRAISNWPRSACSRSCACARGLQHHDLLGHLVVDLGRRGLVRRDQVHRERDPRLVHRDLLADAHVPQHDLGELGHAERGE